MEEYYFLFGIGFLWTVFASVQDIRTKEVSNWLNFSFIGFALAYRAFYASVFSNFEFFIFGLMGFIFFFVIAHALYYGRAFAGGDAKLLMGFGVILPYTNYLSVVFLGLVFLFVLFLIGALYSLIFSVWIVAQQPRKFKKALSKYVGPMKYLIGFGLLFGLIVVLIPSLRALGFLCLFFTILVIVFLYTKALDVCMVRKIPPQKLQEGDWLEKDVVIGKKTIKKTVHGLSRQDIMLLQRADKAVYIKEGVPFVPAFFLTFIFMVFVFLVLQVRLESLIPWELVFGQVSLPF